MKPTRGENAALRRRGRKRDAKAPVPGTLAWFDAEPVLVSKRVYEAGMRLRAEAAACHLEPDFAVTQILRDEFRRRGQPCAAAFWYSVFAFLFESGWCVSAETPVIVTDAAQLELFPENETA